MKRMLPLRHGLVASSSSAAPSLMLMAFARSITSKSDAPPPPQRPTPSSESPAHSTSSSTASSSSSTPPPPPPPLPVNPHPYLQQMRIHPVARGSNSAGPFPLPDSPSSREDGIREAQRKWSSLGKGEKGNEAILFSSALFLLLALLAMASACCGLDHEGRSTDDTLVVVWV